MALSTNIVCTPAMWLQPGHPSAHRKLAMQVGAWAFLCNICPALWLLVSSLQTRRFHPMSFFAVQCCLCWLLDFRLPAIHQTQDPLSLNFSSTYLPPPARPPTSFTLCTCHILLHIYSTHPHACRTLLCLQLRAVGRYADAVQALKCVVLLFPAISLRLSHVDYLCHSFTT